MQSLSMGEENEQSNDATELSQSRSLGQPTPVPSTLQGAQQHPVQMTPNRNTKRFITDLNSSDWETPNFGGFPQGGRKV